MLIKSIDIACTDLSSSALFYIGLLEFDVLDSTDESISLSSGISLLSLEEYYNRTGISISSNKDKAQGITLELETLNIDKLLYKLYSNDSKIEYSISIQNGKRALSLHDPDFNLIIIKEADDNSKYQSYEPKKEENISKYTTPTFVFDKGNK